MNGHTRSRRDRERRDKTYADKAEAACIPAADPKELQNDWPTDPNNPANRDSLARVRAQLFKEEENDGTQ